MYTQGEWSVTKHPSLDNYLVVLLGDKPYNDSGICRVDYLSDKDEMLANANLIAASPLMYEALKEIVSDLTDVGDCRVTNDSYNLAEQAVAKAEGL